MFSFHSLDGSIVLIHTELEILSFFNGFLYTLDKFFIIVIYLFAWLFDDILQWLHIEHCAFLKMMVWKEGVYISCVMHLPTFPSSLGCGWLWSLSDSKTCPLSWGRNQQTCWWLLYDLSVFISLCMHVAYLSRNLAPFDNLAEEQHTWHMATWLV